MSRTIRDFGFAGFLLCCGAVSSFAGEPVKYRFDGWTVTIRAKDREGSAKPASPNRLPTTTNLGDSRTIDRSKVERLQIRPISYQQTVLAPEPAPAPQSGVATQPVPAPQPGGSPVPVPTPLHEVPPPTIMQLPPSPTGDQTAPTPCPTCTLPIITPRQREYPAKPTVIVPQTAMYRDIYASIPFNRAEYNAYPSYRHDATMEFMFNQMRPTMIQRGTTNVYQYDMSAGYGGNGGWGGFWGGPYTGGWGGYSGAYTYPNYPFVWGMRIHRDR